MKITLPIFGTTTCNYDVRCLVQLYGEQGTLVVKCNNRYEVWGDPKDNNGGIYSSFGLLEFDTENLFKDKSYTSNLIADCIKYEKVKFTPMSGKEMGAWFKKLMNCFERED